jgi:polyferredoxin
MKDSEELKQYLKHMNFDTLKITCEERNRDEKKRRELLKLDKKPHFAHNYRKTLLVYLVLYGLMFWWLLHAIYNRARI